MKPDSKLNVDKNPSSRQIKYFLKKRLYVCVLCSHQNEKLANNAGNTIRVSSAKQRIKFLFYISSHMRE